MKDSESTPSSLLIPIEQVPLGARVPTKSPKPCEFDDSLPEPDQLTWGKISITMFRSDGGIVDAEILRPRSWIARHKIVAGQHLPMNIEELQVHGSAFVTAVDECPEIASGKGSVVTARFITREVNSIVRAEILGPDGKIEVIEGTPIHPIWSVDRNDWVPLGELTKGERLFSTSGTSKILSLSYVNCSIAVYNIEIHGEHVYQIGMHEIMVHNASPARCAMIAEYGEDFMDGWQAAHIIPKTGWSWAPKQLKDIIDRVTKEGHIDDVANLFASTPGHAGTHTRVYVNDVIKIMGNRNTKEEMIEGINTLWLRIKAGKY